MVRNNHLLITGGLGQVGYHLYKQLKNSYEITIIDNYSNSKVKPPKDVRFIEGNIKDIESFKELNHIDSIVHAAAQISVDNSTKNPIYDAENNIMGSLQILEFTRKNDIKKFVHISSAATYGEPQYLPIDENHPRNPLSPYGLSKLVSERYAIMYSKLYGLDISAIIPFNIYSPLQQSDDPYAGVIFKFIEAIKKMKNISIEGDGLQTRDFVHVSDVCKAIKLVLESNKTKGGIYNIGLGKPISINELAKNLIQFSSKKIQIKYVEPRLGDIRESYCTIEKAKKELDYHPMSFEEGLQLMFKELK